MKELIQILEFLKTQYTSETINLKLELAIQEVKNGLVISQVDARKILSFALMHYPDRKIIRQAEKAFGTYREEDDVVFR